MMPARSPTPSPFDVLERARVDLVDHRPPPPVLVRPAAAGSRASPRSGPPRAAPSARSERVIARVERHHQGVASSARSRASLSGRQGHVAVYLDGHSDHVQDPPVRLGLVARGAGGPDEPRHCLGRAVRRSARARRRRGVRQARRASKSGCGRPADAICVRPRGADTSGFRRRPKSGAPPFRETCTPAGAMSGSRAGTRAKISFTRTCRRHAAPSRDVRAVWSPWSRDPILGQFQRPHFPIGAGGDMRFRAAAW